MAISRSFSLMKQVDRCNGFHLPLEDRIVCPKCTAAVLNRVGYEIDSRVPRDTIDAVRWVILRCSNCNAIWHRYLDGREFRGEPEMERA